MNPARPRPPTAATPALPGGPDDGPVLRGVRLDAAAQPIELRRPSPAPAAAPGDAATPRRLPSPGGAAAGTAASAGLGGAAAGPAGATTPRSALPTAAPQPGPLSTGRADERPAPPASQGAALQPTPAGDARPPAHPAALPTSATPPFPAGAYAAPPVPSPTEAVQRAEQDRLLRESLAEERQRVLERAHEEGFAQGRDEAHAELRDEVDAMRALVGAWPKALHGALQAAEDTMVEIAFEAACKVLGDALVRREGVEACVREALAEVREREGLVVRLASRDHALLTGGGRTAWSPDGRRVELVADERVLLGGCLIETSGGTLDARLETQLQRLRDTLLGVARHGAEGSP